MSDPGKRDNLRELVEQYGYWDDDPEDDEPEQPVESPPLWTPRRIILAIILIIMLISLLAYDIAPLFDRPAPEPPPPILPIPGDRV